MFTARNLVTLMRSTSMRLASRHLALVSIQECLVHSRSSAPLESSLGSWKKSILLVLRTISPCNSSRRCRKNSTRGTTPSHHTCAFHLQTISQPLELLAAVLLCWYVIRASRRILWLISTVIDLPLYPCSHPSPSCMRLPWPTSFFVIACSRWIFKARYPNH
jgi:hypothetical protein